MENLYTPDCIRTVSGIYLNVLSPTEDMITIEDIAHGLSHQCRFGGHTKKFYSVAEHSIKVSILLPEEHRLAGLLHDASEAYLADIPSPIKKHIPGYLEMENSLMTVIANKFGFQWPLHDLVKDADKKMLEREWDTIVLQSFMSGAVGVACNYFLRKFYSLSK